MRSGQASRTAEAVCAGRALAHGAAAGTRFEDPTALLLLSDAGRERVTHARSDVRPQELRARIHWSYLRRHSKIMLVRTIAIDDALRAVGSPQVVILGAGLDGRAWRMPELANVVVFEVDHPDSQRVKRARIPALTPGAHDIRFVPVDFERDSLSDALANAGHDPARPTTWIWEGVVMYLTPADVEATLGAIARRSAATSRLVIVYHSPAFLLRLAGLYLRYLGEPLRSAFQPSAMRALLAKYGFVVARDDDIHALAAALAPGLAEAMKVAKHLRVVTADRARSR